MITPPNTPPPIDNFTSFSGIRIDGVGLDIAHSRESLTHVRVGAVGSHSARSSWLGWAVTDRPVPQAYVQETAVSLGRELLAALNSEALCVGAMEELRRCFRRAQDEETEARQRGDKSLADFEGGRALGLAETLPLLEVIIDRVGPGFAAKAHQPARDRAAAEQASTPPMTHAESIAALVGAIKDGLGDRADIRLLEVGPNGVKATDITDADKRAESLWSRIQCEVTNAGMTCYATEAPKHARGAVAIVIGHPSVMYADQPGEPVTADKLFEGATTRAELIRLLRAAQAERDALVHETGRMHGEINGLVSRVQTLTEEGPGFTELTRRALAEDGIEDPTTAVLRTRLMHEHVKNARDLAHKLNLGAETCHALDTAEMHTSEAYRRFLANKPTT